MAVLVQSAVLDVMQAVFHLPMAASQRLKIGRRHRLRVETRHEITSVAGFKLRSMPDLPVDAKTDAAIRDSQRIANPIGDLVVAPEFSDVYAAAFFSTVTSSGSDASLKWNVNASSVSP